MDVKLDKQSKIPVYLQIVDQLRAQIMCGALPSGSVLPSERGLAQMLEVHRNTVVKAYGELKSDAWIESRQGIGYVVAVPPAAEDGGEGEAGASDKPSRRVNWINEIKDRHLDMEKTFDDLFQRFTDESKYSLGSGISTNEVFRPERVAHDIAPLMTSAGCCQYFYSPYKGDKFLRQKLVSFLSTKGVKASTGEIQILSETNQAVDFIVTLLVQPGDTVVMEEPVHPDMSRAMELAGAKILTVPVDQDGMRVDLLEKLILHKHPRFIFVNSSFHDPTGHILSLERRKKIIEISNTYRVPIVEEDAASELVYEGEKLPPIKAFDTLENVIYIYSFSLTFVTGLSIAVVVANADVIRSLSYLVSVRLMASDWMTQKLLAAIAKHPNAGGVLVLSLGCENLTHEQFAEELGPYDPARVKFLTCQDVEDEMEAGGALLAELAAHAGQARREAVPVCELVVGMKCGGSDGLSGITANPAVGRFSDMLCARGGSTILTEVPEMFGAEGMLLGRCQSRAVFDKAASMLNGFKEYFLAHGETVYENPSPGNKQGGITTLEDKSCGCVQKGGSAPIVDVVGYGEQVHARGLNLLNGPGNDLVSATALTAAGAQLVLFTTGRGTPFGAPAPTLKIATNTPLAEKKKGWIDFNAGTIADGSQSIGEAGAALYVLVLDVASGKQTRTEQKGYREISIFKDGVVL